MKERLGIMEEIVQPPVWMTWMDMRFSGNST